MARPPIIVHVTTHTTLHASRASYQVKVQTRLHTHRPRPWERNLIDQQLRVPFLPHFLHLFKHPHAIGIWPTVRHGVEEICACGHDGLGSKEDVRHVFDAIIQVHSHGKDFGRILQDQNAFGKAGCCVEGR
jgi:hypothetical protein